MAIAYACDRCGDLFKSKDLKNHVEVILDNNARFVIKFDYGEMLQICPKCRASFQKWWDEDAVHKTTDPDHPYVTTLYETEKNKNEKDNL